MLSRLFCQGEKKAVPYLYKGKCETCGHITKHKEILLPSEVELTEKITTVPKVEAFNGLAFPKKGAPRKLNQQQESVTLSDGRHCARLLLFNKDEDLLDSDNDTSDISAPRSLQEKAAVSETPEGTTLLLSHKERTESSSPFQRNSILHRAFRKKRKYSQLTNKNSLTSLPTSRVPPVQKIAIAVKDKKCNNILASTKPTEEQTVVFQDPECSDLPLTKTQSSKSLMGCNKDTSNSSEFKSSEENKSKSVDRQGQTEPFCIAETSEILPTTLKQTKSAVAPSEQRSESCLCNEHSTSSSILESLETVVKPKDCNGLSVSYNNKPDISEPKPSEEKATAHENQVCDDQITNAGNEGITEEIVANVKGGCFNLFQSDSSEPKVTLRINHGAVTTPTRIQVTQIKTGFPNHIEKKDILSNIYDLRPHNLELKEPVWIDISFEGDDQEPEHIGVMCNDAYAEQNPKWRVLTNDRNNPRGPIFHVQGNTCSVKTNHLRPFFIVSDGKGNASKGEVIITTLDAKYNRRSKILQIDQTCHPSCDNFNIEKHLDTRTFALFRHQNKDMNIRVKLYVNEQEKWQFQCNEDENAEIWYYDLINIRQSLPNLYPKTTWLLKNIGFEETEVLQLSVSVQQPIQGVPPIKLKAAKTLEEISAGGLDNLQPPESDHVDLYASAAAPDSGISSYSYNYFSSIPKEENSDPMHNHGDRTDVQYKGPTAKHKQVVICINPDRR